MNIATRLIINAESVQEPSVVGAVSHLIANTELVDASFPSGYQLPSEVVVLIKALHETLKTPDDYHRAISCIKELRNGSPDLAGYLEKIFQLHFECRELMENSGIPQCATNIEAQYARETKRILDTLPDLLKKASKKGEPYIYIPAQKSYQEIFRPDTLWARGFASIVTPLEPYRFLWFKIKRTPLVQNIVDSDRLTRDHCTNVPSRMLWDFCAVNGIRFTLERYYPGDSININEHFRFSVPRF